MSDPNTPAPNPVIAKPAGPQAGPEGLMTLHPEQAHGDVSAAVLREEPLATSSAPLGAEPNVQRMHNSIQRELEDPTDGFEPIPFWMVMIFAVLLFWGGMYMSKFDGHYRADMYDKWKPGEVSNVVAPKPEKPPETFAEYAALGARVYNQCAGCHQADGNGNAGGGIPPLNQSEWVSGENQSPARLSRILLYGLNGNILVKGKPYNGQMPAWGSQLKDHQIAGVLTYVRSNWDNKAAFPKPEDALITTEMVAAARAKEGSRSTSGGAPMSAPQLLGVAQVSDLAGGATAPPAGGGNGATAGPPKQDGAGDTKQGKK